MIWLAWRRQRVVMLGFVGVAVALGIWMVLDANALNSQRNVCRVATYQCGFQYSPTSIESQAEVIDFLLLLLPCVAGIIFGAPLVGRDLERNTNRIAWTQGVSRSKWLLESWAVVALPLVAVSAALALVAQWWSGHVFARLPLDLMLGGRIQPNVFAVTGIAPIAYSMFALALGALLGTVMRRVSLAGVGLIVLYAVVALMMAIFIRPFLAPQAFLAETTSNSQQYVTLPSPEPWNLGYRYRFAPGTTTASSASLSQIAQRCRLHSTGSPGSNAAIGRCLASHHVQGASSCNRRITTGASNGPKRRSISQPRSCSF